MHRYQAISHAHANLVLHIVNYLQKAEATLAVSSTGRGPTPPRGMSRTVAPRLLKVLPASAPLDLDGRNARPPEGKRDAEVGRANTTAARNGRSFILAMVRRLDLFGGVKVKSYFWACLSPVVLRKNEHILCLFSSDTQSPAEVSQLGIPNALVKREDQ